MASNIVPGNIDGTYPTAGQDNSSQGFRDNFTAIKNNFTEAKTEIDSLQTNKANLNSTNNFSGNTIQNAVLKNNSETSFAHGSVSSGSVTLDHENGHYQIDPSELFRVYPPNVRKTEFETATEPKTELAERCNHSHYPKQLKRVKSLSQQSQKL